MTSDDRDPVDVLAEEFADRLRRGEHPSVGDYASAHPEHAEQLRELLPAVAQMEMLKRFRHPGAAPALPDRLGDFRIVRELGRGGMGVVFEAVQESLGRPVALKVLARHAQLDAKRRERFVREAQAAAKLHHTNIVPVFGVGEQDGLPYYVMQLIPGYGLHTLVWQWRKDEGLEPAPASKTAVVNDFDTEPAGGSGGPQVGAADVRGPRYADWRFVAQVGMQAADALHYAHKQGVLHRDVKPGNLILDGETVWVTDFGLAKLVNSDGLTATGDILGTLQYLAPECLTGDADARSDVYGLGATLYELLTLESPYTADGPAALIKKVADTDPTPPRRLNPAIPRDLETIVLKAMAREPAARYATAHDMAADLNAFLEDRPIKARRTSAVARAARWCRRNPAVASLALSTVVALTLATVAGWVGYARAEERRKDAEDAQHAAEQERIKADRARADAQKMSERLEENLKLSLDTFEKVFVAATGTGRQGFGVPLPPMFMGGPGGPGGPGPGGPKKDGFGGPGGPLGVPGADSASVQAAILEAVLNFYDEFARKNPPTPQLQFEAAKASRRVCEAYMWSGRSKDAVTAFRRAVGLLEPLVAQFPEKKEMQTELAMTYAVAPPEAFPDDPEEPLHRVTQLAAGNPWLAGTAQMRLGLAREQKSDYSGAERAYRDAVVSFTSVEEKNRPTPGHLEPAFCRLRQAFVLGEQGKLQPARKVLEESVAALLPVAGGGSGPGPGGGRFGPEAATLGQTYRALADVCDKLNDRVAASAARTSANQYGGFGFGPGGPKKDGFGGPWGWGGKKDGPPPKKDGPPK